MKRRIFHRKQYHNPYTAKKGSAANKSNSGKKRIIKIPKFAYFILLVIFLFILGYAQAFQVTEVVVTGEERIEADDVKQVVLNQSNQRRFLLFKQSSIFFFSKNQAAEAIKSQFLVESVKVSKSYFNTIKVALTEKQSGVAWVSNGAQYYLDLEGIALRELELGGGIIVESGGGNTDIVRSELGFGNFPIVYDLSNTAIEIAQPAASEDLAKFILEIFDELLLIGDFNISHFNVERPFSREFSLVAEEGWEARFNIDEDPQVQAGILMSVLNQKIRDRNSLEYIDLRFGERVFYK